MSFGGLVRDVSLAYVPEAEIGDYVIVHVGFAISLLDEAEAMRTFEYLKQMGELEEIGAVKRTVECQLTRRPASPTRLCCAR